MGKVILDTNFLLIPGQFKLDIFTELERLVDSPELCMMEGTVKELARLAEGNSRDAQAAKLGLVLAQQKGLKRLPSSIGHVDDDIVSEADSGTYVATQDRGLKRRVRGKGAKVITMRKKQYLEVEK